MEKYAELVDLGQRLKKTRLMRGYSQEHLAALANMSSRYYGYVERGEKNITYRNLLKILAALEIDFAEILPPLKTMRRLIFHKNLKKARN